ncbi:MAG: class I SAM-dependent methyltransferase [Armatimonadota bacterium]|nr:class I SAM-dependent methyltransferase [Armatimonadota bacterium]
MPRQPEESVYLSFWEDTGAHFPSLKGAVSTDYYRECEEILLRDHIPAFVGRRLLKTDLWDEAKNTEILRWAAEQGARPFGIDISFSVARDARAVLLAHRPGCVVADARALPFASNSFDLIYSMGTIEHFHETETAIGEMYRVLKPGGIAVVGVPNKLDPFLRPVMSGVMQWLHVYPYGMEKSFTAGGLRRMLTRAGFRVAATSGVLFMPGWLRILDLWFHVRSSPLAALTGWLTRPFAWAYRRFPAVRRHGYLVACVAEKPHAAPAGGRP